MRKLTIRLIAASLTFLVGITAATVWLIKRQPPPEKARVIKPQAKWEPIFFREINSVAKLSAQTDLRQAILAEGDVEMRMWWGFGLEPLEGIILRHIAGQWSAIHVKADRYSDPTRAIWKTLSTPKSGWDACWERLVDAGILELPDAQEVNCSVDGFDGIAFIVETNTGQEYRTYRYGNPTLAQCKEAKQMVKITEIIDQEFRWKD